MTHKLVLVLLVISSSLCVANDIGEEGKSIAFDQGKGNCLACHVIAGGESPGNIGPELSNMKARYPDQSLLRQRVWDETKFYPASIMPPFGKHQILTENEIDKVVEFLYTL